MKSIRELYKIGFGPSSSHTMGVSNAVNAAVNKVDKFDFVRVILQGSLALTGKGHLSDFIVSKTLGDIPHEVVFDYETIPSHPNSLDIYFYLKEELIEKFTIYSVGGGDILFKDEEKIKSSHIYELKTFDQIKEYVRKKNIRLYDYVYENENSDFKKYLKLVYDKMLLSVERGLNETGVLPGRLNINRKANKLYNLNKENEDYEMKNKRLIVSYAYAVCEENACGGEIVTAPTCGASGILPSLLRYYKDKNKFSEEELLNALATAGLIGNLIKHNASISGAECGCQAEIGAACSMGAGFVAELYNLSIGQIETACEIALEHHLGLTCDPIEGFVQIPCIERNAVCALRSIDASMLSSFLNDNDSKISFDMACKTLKMTGKDIHVAYRETSQSGLAKVYFDVD